MEAGITKTLKVVREAPFGFFLTDGEEDVLLHHTEISRPIQLEQDIEVFLYQDHEGRLSASLTIPNIQLGQYDWAQVVGVSERLGVFIDIGLQKDILISLDDLPEDIHLWPTVGDRLYCTLTRNNKNRLFGKIAPVEEIELISVAANESLFNKSIKGTVYRILQIGSSIITEEGYLGFIHESERNEELRLGQQVEGRVTNVKEDGSMNVSLLPRTHERLSEDAALIYDYLLERGGSMPYSDKSLPEDIKRRFNMSKGAFKRALGKLIKEDKIIQEDGWTHAKNQKS